MAENFDPTDDNDTSETLRRIDDPADRRENELREMPQPSTEESLEEATDLGRHLLLELVVSDVQMREAAAGHPHTGDPLLRFPEDPSRVADLRDRDETLNAPVPLEAGTISDDGTKDLPASLGRYRVQRRLGRGSFGEVYLAIDPQLDRPVAVKIPRRDRFVLREQLMSFVKEARTTAKLKHPGIVAVYDVQEWGGFSFIVQEYIDGPNLAEWAKSKKPSYESVVQIIVQVAEAVGYAHQQGFVHCDLKLANVLMDSAGMPHVADFGLAVHESFQKALKGQRFGTPVAMSPEQVRGESHLLDGRTDIWALGVMLYQLLVGRPPFESSSQLELFEMIRTRDPKSPRQVVGRVPRELDRICLKCLSRRSSDRYQTTDSLKEDLLAWLTDGTARREPHSAAGTIGQLTSLESPSTSSQPAKIVPKGLVAFDEKDADFFLELLPGSRDRSGLPDSIRFWKERIEETDSDQTFRVGLIYGPSGSGKSSLIKAGLLPHLSDQVLPIYVEATAADTEARIISQLRKHLPHLADDADLPAICAEMRKTGAGRGRKVLLIVDQFEQWLYGTADLRTAQLVDGLRQCDGGRLQALLLVRDDFYLSVNRLFQELDIRLLEGHNQGVVDRFDMAHALKVLTAFGQAYGKLGEVLTPPQEDFLQQAIEQLAEDRKVISVRLALFADMMKSRVWLPASLRQVGGVGGVGESFLEESFGERTTSITHRVHAHAIRQVLKSLIPETGTDIKGTMQSVESLRAESGYVNRDKDFDELLTILDREMRLITPTDPAGTTGNMDGQWYQLTHDYLVASLRAWLTRKQKETRQGRAELLLADRAADWNACPENRQLPSLWQWLQIRRYTPAKNWTESQRKMMSKAGRLLGVRWGSSLAILLVVGIVIQQYVAFLRHRNLVERVHTSVASMRVSRGLLVPRAIADLNELPDELVIEELKARFEDSKPSEKLSLAYALADYGEGDLSFLVGAMEEAPSIECQNFVTALGYNRDRALEQLSELAKKADAGENWVLKGRLAIIGLHLGDATLGIDVHADRPEPTQQTVFIHDVFPRWHGDLDQLADVIDLANDPSLRTGMCLAIGNLLLEQLGDAKAKWQNLLTNWHTQSPDAGTHNAAGWALRQWNVASLVFGADRVDPVERDWMVTPHGFAMVRIAAGQFKRREGEIHQTVTLTKDFWMSDVEVTVELFQKFVDDQGYQGLKPREWGSVHTGISPTSQHPVQSVNWYDAVMFCNWLSWKEGRRPCYHVEVSTTPFVGEVLTVTFLSDGNGYRLPTEAEWEYACRSGTTTDFSFGNDAQPMNRYAVFAVTTAEVVGSKMCNRWGLFDMHGNVAEWCHDWYGKFTDGMVENPTGLDSSSHRIHRGGSWYFAARRCRSMARDWDKPEWRLNHLGFRLVKVFSPLGQ